MLKILCSVFSFLLVAFPNNQGICFASTSDNPEKTQEVSINEIAWMGTNLSYSDEWIELYNASKAPVNLDKWKIETPDKSITILLKGEIPAKEFFLLERTNDETVAEIKADIVYTGGLNNNGKHLKLINAHGELVESIDCSTGWFAGDNETKRTMEKINPEINGNAPENWQTSQNPGGTPQAQNSSGFVEKKIADLEKSIKFSAENKSAANLFFGKDIDNNKNNFGSLVASIVAVFSATTILILKKTLK